MLPSRHVHLASQPFSQVLPVAYRIPPYRHPSVDLKKVCRYLKVQEKIKMGDNLEICNKKAGVRHFMLWIDDAQ